MLSKERTNERTNKATRIAAIALSILMVAGLIPANVAAAKKEVKPAETVETEYKAPESSNRVSMYASSVRQATVSSPAVTSELVAQLRAHKSVIVLKKGYIRYTASNDAELAKQVGKYVGNVLNSHPEMFYVSASGIQIYPNRSNKTVVKLVPKYTMSKSQAATATKRMNTQAKAIEKKVNRKWSVKKKALTVNNLLKSRVRYTSSGANKQNAYGALVQRKGVCQAYTMAYEYIMRDLKIPTSYQLNRSGSHIWNRVKYRGRWYTVDVTWNDTTKSNKYFWKTRHAM